MTELYSWLVKDVRDDFKKIIIGLTKVVSTLVKVRACGEGRRKKVPKGGVDRKRERERECVCVCEEVNE